MPAPWVVEALDLVEHVGSDFVACAVDLTSGPFGLQRGEEALRCRIVPDIARSAHGTGDPVVGKQALEWVDWFNNRRLLEPIGNITPTEAEANFYAALETEPMAA